jgi:membrane protease subunit (stomatin/prohibitin family)
MTMPSFDPFYVGLLAVLVLVAAGVYIWEKGLLGTATEARIKVIIAKLQHDVEVWQGKLAAKTAKPEETTMGAQLIALNEALLKGVINQAEYDAAKAKILNG